MAILNLKDEPDALVFIAVVDVLIPADLVGFAVGCLDGVKGGADFDVCGSLDAIVAGNLDVACVTVYKLQLEGIAVLVLRYLAIPHRMVLRLHLCRRAVHLPDVVLRSSIFNAASDECR